MRQRIMRLADLKKRENVHTCYIFLQHPLFEETHYSLVCDENQQILHPLEKRSIDQLKGVQENTVTYLILPASLGTIYHLSLPYLSAKKFMTALHFFLEKKIPDALHDLHLAYQYDKTSQSYLIALVKKNILQQVFELFSEAGIYFQGAYLDASLLKPNEALFQDNRTWLVYTPDFHGAVPEAFEAVYEAYLHHILCYTNQPLPNHLEKLLSVELLHEPSYIWLAQRLIPNQHLNLCQGEFKKSAPRSSYPMHRVAISLGIVWLLSIVLSHSVTLYQLRAFNKSTHAQIVAQYKELFPNNNQSTTTETQLSRLKETKAVAPVWQLIDALGAALMTSSVNVNSLTYESHHLVIKLTADDFKSIDRLKSNLSALKIKVAQTHAEQQNNTVTSTLELSVS